jgi:hypothetical protein
MDLGNRKTHLPLLEVDQNPYRFRLEYAVPVRLQKVYS